MSFNHVQLATYCKYVYIINTDAMVIRRNNHSTIIFQGSDSLENWKDNLSFLCRTKHDIHPGFHRHTINVIRKHKLLPVFKTSDHVTLTGHSLAACSSVLTAYFVHKTMKNPPSMDLVLFGSPKIGGDLFRSEFESLEYTSC